MEAATPKPQARSHTEAGSSRSMFFELMVKIRTDSFSRRRQDLQCGSFCGAAASIRLAKTGGQSWSRLRQVAGIIVVADVLLLPL
jgi:hypothetical protein